MTSTGFRAPTSGASTSITGHAGLTWQGPTKCYADDATSASDTTNCTYITSASFDTGTESYSLRVKGFDFAAIPDDATIAGVRVKINAWYQNGSGSLDMARLLDASGVEAGDNLLASAQALSTDAATVYTIGATNSTWNNALTPTWVKDPDFGVAIGGVATALNCDIFIDYVSLEVTYTGGTPPTGIWVDWSSPPNVTQTGNTAATIVTAAFTPPANTLVVAMTGIVWGGSGTYGATYTVTDSLNGDWSNNYKIQSEAGNPATYTGVWTRWVSSSAEMTVTLTTDTAQKGKQLTVVVLNNVRSSNWIGAHPVTFQSPSVAGLQQNVQTTVAQSWVLGSSSYDTTGTISANANTTQFNQLVDATDGARIQSFRNKTPGDPATTSFGHTGDTAAISKSYVALEVLPSIPNATVTGLSPVAAVAGVGSAAIKYVTDNPPSVTTSKTPYGLSDTAANPTTKDLTQITVATGDVLMVICESENYVTGAIAGVAKQAGTATIANGNLRQTSTTTGMCGLGLWTADVTAGGTLTLRASLAGNGARTNCLFLVYIATNCTGVGNTTLKESEAGNGISTNLTTSVHSYVVAHAADWNAFGGTTTTLTPGGYVLDLHENNGVVDNPDQAGQFSSRGGHWSDVSAGTVAYGVTAPASWGKYNLVVGELLGTGAVWHTDNWAKPSTVAGVGGVGTVTAGPVVIPVAFDAVGPAGGGTNVETNRVFADWTHTIGASATNTLLLAALAIDMSNEGGVTADVRCAGTSMTLLGRRSASDGGNGCVFVFYMVGVSPGAKTMSCSTTGFSAGAGQVASISFSGVDQTNPFEIPLWNAPAYQTTATSASQVVPSKTNDMVFATMVNGGSAWVEGNTKRFAGTASGGAAAGNLLGETATGAASVTMSGSHVNADWDTICAFNIRQATSQISNPTPVGSTLSAATASATSLPVAYPPGIVSGDLLTLFVGTKPYTASITTPGGWTAQGSKTNGTTAAGADTGSMLLNAYTKTAAGTETGTLTVTVGSGNSSWGVMTRTAKPAGKTWQIANTTGTASASTSWSSTMAADPGIDTGDVVWLGAATSTDLACTDSANALSATGATFQTMSGHGNWNPRITTGNQSGGTVGYAIATGGPSSAPPVWSMTKSVSTNQSASTVLVRLRAAVTGDQTVNATTVAAVAGVGAATKVVRVVPSTAIAGVAAQPAPTKKVAVSASVVAGVAAAPARTLHTGETVSAGVVVGTAGVGTIVGVVRKPAGTVAAVVGTPASTLRATKPASVVAGIAGVGSATPRVVVPAGTVSGVAAVGVPTLHAGERVSPATVGGVAGVGTATLHAGEVVSATTVPTVGGVGSVTLHAGASVTAVLVAGVAGVGTAALYTPRTVGVVAAIGGVGTVVVTGSTNAQVPAGTVAGVGGVGAVIGRSVKSATVVAGVAGVGTVGIAAGLTVGPIGTANAAAAVGSVTGSARVAATTVAGTGGVGAAVGRSAKPAGTVAGVGGVGAVGISAGLTATVVAAVGTVGTVGVATAGNVEVPAVRVAATVGVGAAAGRAVAPVGAVGAVAGVGTAIEVVRVPASVVGAVAAAGGTAQAGVGLAPSTVVGAGGTGTVSLAAGSVVIAGTVAGVGAVGTVAIALPGVVAAGVVATVGGVGAASVSTGWVVGVATVVTAGSVGTVTPRAGTVVSPSRVTATAAQPSATAKVLAAPATVAAVVAQPAPEVTCISGDATVSGRATVAAVAHQPTAVVYIIGQLNATVAGITVIAA